MPPLGAARDARSSLLTVALSPVPWGRVASAQHPAPNDPTSGLPRTGQHASDPIASRPADTLLTARTRARLGRNRVARRHRAPHLRDAPVRRVPRAASLVAERFPYAVRGRRLTVERACPRLVARACRPSTSTPRSPVQWPSCVCPDPSPSSVRPRRSWSPGAAATSCPPPSRPSRLLDRGWTSPRRGKRDAGPPRSGGRSWRRT